MENGERIESGNGSREELPARVQQKQHHQQHQQQQPQQQKHNNYQDVLSKTPTSKSKKSPRSGIDVHISNEMATTNLNGNGSSNEHDDVKHGYVNSKDDSSLRTLEYQDSTMTTGAGYGAGETCPHTEYLELKQQAPSTPPQASQSLQQQQQRHEQKSLKSQLHKLSTVNAAEAKSLPKRNSAGDLLYELRNKSESNINSFNSNHRQRKSLPSSNSSSTASTPPILSKSSDNLKALGLVAGSGSGSGSDPYFQQSKYRPITPPANKYREEPGLSYFNYDKSGINETRNKSRSRERIRTLSTGSNKSSSGSSLYRLSKPDASSSGNTNAFNGVHRRNVSFGGIDESKPKLSGASGGTNGLMTSPRFLRDFKAHSNLSFAEYGLSKNGKSPSTTKNSHYYYGNNYSSSNNNNSSSNNGQHHHARNELRNRLVDQFFNLSVNVQAPPESFKSNGVPIHYGFPSATLLEIPIVNGDPTTPKQQDRKFNWGSQGQNHGHSQVSQNGTLDDRNSANFTNGGNGATSTKGPYTSPFALTLETSEELVNATLNHGGFKFQYNEKEIIENDKLVNYFLNIDNILAELGVKDHDRNDRNDHNHRSDHHQLLVRELYDPLLKIMSVVSEKLLLKQKEILFSVPQCPSLVQLDLIRQYLEFLKTEITRTKLELRDRLVETRDTNKEEITESLDKLNEIVENLVLLENKSRLYKEKIQAHKQLLNVEISQKLDLLEDINKRITKNKSIQRRQKWVRANVCIGVLIVVLGVSWFALQ